VTTASASARVWRPSPGMQWGVVAATVVVAAVLGLLLPLWADATEPPAPEIDAAGRVTGAGLSVEPAEGWFLDAGAKDSIKLEKGDASLLMFPPAASAESPASVVEASVDAFRADTTIAYQIGEIETFTTSSGLTGASAVVLDPESATVIVAVSDGTQLSQGLVTAKAGTWPEVDDDAAAMIRSLSFDLEDAS